MTAIDLLLHLLGFAAPAFATALLVTAAAPAVLPRAHWALGWWGCLAANFVTGLAVLAAGLWHFGRDGKMATYGALVVAVASAQWVLGRGWRR